MAKTYTITNPYTKDEDTIVLYTANYGTNNNLAIKAMSIDPEYGFETPYAVLTVNLGEKLPANQAYLDINNFREGMELVVNNGLARYTGKMGHSGFCTYPLMEFDMDALKEAVN